MKCGVYDLVLLCGVLVLSRTHASTPSEDLLRRVGYLLLSNILAIIHRLWEYLSPISGIGSIALFHQS